DDDSFNPIDIRPDTSRPEAGLLKLSCEKANTELDWHPTMDFARTAKMTADWYQHFYAQPQSIVDLTNQQIDDYCALAKAQNIGWAQSDR
ncbi:MAG: CDP-glucose 4,6-dehydratase, partial [Planctomycetota bacterium]